MVSEQNRNVLVIYHGGCWDGFCAAWLLHREYPRAEFLPARYGESAPDVTGRSVFVVDFSYPRDVLQRMNLQARSLIVLDHHKTAREALEGLPYCVFEAEKSGARMTYEFIDRVLHQNERVASDPIPWLVLYTEDRDLWRWEMDSSREVNAWLRSHPLEFELWDQFASISHHSDQFFGWIDEGGAILRSNQQTIEAKLEHSHIIPVPVPNCVGPYLRWKIANATTLVSETAGALAEETGIGCTWFEKPDGERVYSLRSPKGTGVDVGWIAKKFGGGGHKHAAGFQSYSHPWNVTLGAKEAVGHGQQ